jgi:hypothetical protein
MSAALWSEPYDPHQRLGDIQLDTGPIPPPPLNSLPPAREHVMTIRVYHVRPDGTRYTDADHEAQSGL